MTTNINDMLKGREGRYGSFEVHAKIAQGLKAVMHERSGWDALAQDQKEALDMIQHKIARILNGDPNYDDSWRDIAGYATLIERHLNGEDI